MVWFVRKRLQVFVSSTAYWATSNHERAGVPNMNAEDALKKEHRVFPS